MAWRPDVILYDSLGRSTAVVELKNRRGTSAEWAAELRRNLVAHGLAVAAEFFLVITPDRIYMWRGAGLDPRPVPPTAEADAGPLFSPYFEMARVEAGSVSAQAFELVVGAWLADLARGVSAAPGASPEQRQRLDPQFFAAIRDGRIEYQAAA